MVYEFTQEMREISIAEIGEAHPTLGLISLEELRQNRQLLGFAEATVEECENQDGTFRGAIDTYAEYCFGVLNLIDFDTILGRRDRVGFYLKKNLLLLVDVCDSDQSTQSAFCFALEHAQKGTVCIERLSYLVLERLLYGGGKALEQIGYAIDTLGEQLLEQKSVKKVNRILLQKKKELLLLHNYYEQLIDIGEELQENNVNYFAAQNLRYFKLFTDKAERLGNNTQLLRENLLQVRESYETALGYHQNKAMRSMAVLTAIFAPLSLITNWYGMNFENMPLLDWHYGPFVVIGLSVLAVGVCLAVIWRTNCRL